MRYLLRDGYRLMLTNEALVRLGERAVTSGADVQQMANLLRRGSTEVHR